MWSNPTPPLLAPRKYSRLWLSPYTLWTMPFESLSPENVLECVMPRMSVLQRVAPCNGNETNKAKYVRIYWERWWTTNKHDGWWPPIGQPASLLRKYNAYSFLYFTMKASISVNQWTTKTEMVATVAARLCTVVSPLLRPVPCGIALTGYGNNDDDE